MVNPVAELSGNHMRSWVETYKLPPLTSSHEDPRIARYNSAIAERIRYHMIRNAEMPLNIFLMYIASEWAHSAEWWLDHKHTSPETMAWDAIRQFAPTRPHANQLTLTM